MSLLDLIRVLVPIPMSAAGPENRGESLDRLPPRLSMAPRAAAAALENYARRPPPQITAEGMRQVIDVVWESEGYAARKGEPEKYMDVCYASAPHTSLQR